MYREDKDFFAVSSSSSEYFTRTSQVERKKAGLKKKLEEKQAKINTGHQLTKIDTSRKLGDLNTEISDGGKDAEDKRRKKEEAKDKAGKTFGTKTLKQMEEAEIEGGSTKMDPDKMVQKEQQQNEAEAQSEQEFQAQMG